MAEPSDLDPTGPRPRGPRQPSVHGPTARDRVTSGGADRRCEVRFGNTVPCPFLYGTNRSESERDCRMDPLSGTGRPAGSPGPWDAHAPHGGIRCSYGFQVKPEWEGTGLAKWDTGSLSREGAWRNTRRPGFAVCVPRRHGREQGAGFSTITRT